ncbi:Abi-alpha family protein [Mucilaginibacter panaciglaebae]|uniref:DUF4393 domain-containing protein n=1 Tax=Mucilaginibacter panaciglaebae TaxID=502331 RepID=A0ABP7WMW3_9SPHI
MTDLEKLGNIFGAETIKRVYEDGFSGSVQEAGKMLTDLMKSARLFTMPFQLAANYQDRITKYFERVRNSVPENNQQSAPASLSGPIIERLKFLEEDNYLTDLYLNLLSRAIDIERVNEAHPAFFHIIDQLSPDEALFLFKLKDIEIKVTTYRDLDREANKFINYQITKTDLPATQFNFPEHFHMYYSHLESLNLVTWPVVDTEYPQNEAGIQTGLIQHSIIKLTDFGALFVKACIPEKGFIFMKNNNNQE